MRWSWRIGQIAGIGIYLHLTFVILLIAVAAQHLFLGQSVSMVAMALASILGLFGIVVLHELGHAMAARRYGIGTQDITLLPIGGVARLERMPDDPKQEFVVALAGPAVNVVLATFAFALLAFLPAKSHYDQAFQLADANGDNALSFEELSARAQGLTPESFDQYDLNHDGFLTRDELLWRGANPIQRALHAILAENPYGGASASAGGSSRMVSGSLIVDFFKVNFVLVAFNLLPAFPMDGGRVLRALLAMRLDHARATQIAATVGQGMAFLFGVVGLSYSQPVLLFIALFVWMGAAAESEMAQTKSALRGVRVKDAMITKYHALSTLDPLSDAITHVLAGFQQDFPVLEEGRLVGVLTRGDLLKFIANSGQETRVGDAMQRVFETAAPMEMLDSVFHRLQESDCRTLPVVQDGQLVGLLTMDNLGEFMMLRAALRGEAARG
ncbi:MAG: site-2 protease family protein [Candidatus Hydrogenedentes bacterium]|nr:site-2 protease family protein [Candidatus Hydrogenedentota bacterium]